MSSNVQKSTSTNAASIAVEAANRARASAIEASGYASQASVSAATSVSVAEEVANTKQLINAQYININALATATQRNANKVADLSATVTANTQLNEQYTATGLETLQAVQLIEQNINAVVPGVLQASVDAISAKTSAESSAIASLNSATSAEASANKASIDALNTKNNAISAYNAFQESSKNATKAINAASTASASALEAKGYSEEARDQSVSSASYASLANASAKSAATSLTDVTAKAERVRQQADSVHTDKLAVDASEANITTIGQTITQQTADVLTAKTTVLETATEVSSNANKAKTSETNAKASETNAKASETTAVQSAKEATSSARVTEQYEISSRSNATLAVQAKTSAESSATSASVSANNAGTSEQQTLVYTQTNKGYYDTVLVQATEINADALSAEASKSIAESSSTSATASATNALTYSERAREYADQAAQSKIDAQTVANSIGLDNNGNLTVTGITSAQGVINAFGGITNLPTPVNDSDAVNKKITDNTESLIKPLLQDFYNSKRSFAFMFANDTKIKDFSFSFAQPTSLERCFEKSGVESINTTITYALGGTVNLYAAGLLLGCTNLKEAIIVQDGEGNISLQSLVHTCNNLKKLHLTADAHGLHLGYLLIGTNNLEELVITMPNFTGYNDERNLLYTESCTKLLKCEISFPALEIGTRLFKHNRLKANMIEFILTSIPDRTGMANDESKGIGVIDFSGTHNSIELAKVDWSIAENKNWICIR